MASKKVPLTIYLLKQPSQNAIYQKVDFLKTTVDSRGRQSITPHIEYALGQDGELGTLYVRKPKPESPPEWVTFVSPGLEDPSHLQKYKNKSVSAVLIRSINNRQFAITFGHGRYLLNQNLVESRFGIHVALNSLLPEKIASIDKHSFDATPKLTRTQVIKLSSISEFGIDAEQDLLRAIVGSVKEDLVETLGNVLAGMDSLKISTQIDIFNLHKTLGVALKLHKSKEYLKTPDGLPSPFAWVDNLKQVTDKFLLTELESCLAAEFDSGVSEKMWLSVPEIIDWQDMNGYSYTSNQVSNGITFDTLEIDELKKSLNNSAYNDIKNHLIFLIQSNLSTPKTYPLNKCIYSEINYKNSIYVLNYGSWYEINQSFSDQIEDHYKNIKKKNASWPFPKFSHQNEGTYNLAVSERKDSKYVLLDKKNIQFGGGHSKIEICDLYKPISSESKGELVHVKRDKNSQSLSHLFAQGLVSCQLLASEPKFLEQINIQLSNKKQNAIKNPFDAKSHVLTFAIIFGKQGDKFDIPFFSKVNLYNCSKSIRSFGFEIELMHIPAR